MRAAWAAATLAALALLLVLALRSPDRQQSLVAFEAAGTMRHIAPEQVQAVRLSTGPRSRDFERGADGRWRGAGEADGADAASGSHGVAASTATAAAQSATTHAATQAAIHAAIEAGLRLLHNTPPERSFETESPDFGLAAPALKVELRTADGQAFEADFGAVNPIGMAHYARIRSAGQTALHLVPSYLAQAWTPALAEATP